ncbi:MAG: hypothetical protein WBD40_18995 [Tepidisphaeraceae bacterium]
MLKRRRERRAFWAEIAASVEAVRPSVELATENMQNAVDAAIAHIAAMPGAAARCPTCETRMTMERVKDGRKWWTLWSCGGCGETHRPADFPEAARKAGWS